MVVIQGIYFYSVEETSKILGISRKTLYNWKKTVHSGDAKHQFALHPATAPNGRLFFREENIITLLSSIWGITVTPEELRKEGVVVSK